MAAAEVDPVEDKSVQTRDAEVAARGPDPARIDITFGPVTSVVGKSFIFIFINFISFFFFFINKIMIQYQQM